jgi:hypothetical protein
MREGTRDALRAFAKKHKIQVQGNLKIHLEEAISKWTQDEEKAQARKKRRVEEETDTDIAPAKCVEEQPAESVEDEEGERKRELSRTGREQKSSEGAKTEIARREAELAKKEEDFAFAKAREAELEKWLANKEAFAHAEEEQPTFEVYR